MQNPKDRFHETGQEEAGQVENREPNYCNYPSLRAHAVTTPHTTTTTEASRRRVREPRSVEGSSLAAAAAGRGRRKPSIDGMEERKDVGILAMDICYPASTR